MIAVSNLGVIGMKGYKSAINSERFNDFIE